MSKRFALSILRLISDRAASEIATAPPIAPAISDKQVTSILQNAETIRLTDPEGKALSVVNLKPGDKVLVALEEAGRHFGIKIEETITEK